MRIGAASLTLFVATSAAGCELVFPHDGDRSPPPSDGAGPPSDGASGDGPPIPVDGGTDGALPPGCPPQYQQVGERWYRFAAPTIREWTVAADVCAADSALAGPGWFTHLAVISDGTEQAQLLGQIGMTQWAWIGYSDLVAETQFRWVTDEASSANLIWLAQQPDNGAGNGPQHCVRLGAVGLDDDFCNLLQPYVCECDAYANQPANY